MKKFSLLALISLAFAASAPAGLIVDESAAHGYIFSMKTPTDVKAPPVGLLVVLPGKTVKAKLERANWAFPAEHFGFALLALEVDYAQIQKVSDIEALHDRIEAAIADVRSRNPSIDPGPVFLAGSSRGGMAAIALALHYPKLYRAVGAASGGVFAMSAEPEAANARGQKFFFVHGTSDKVVPFEHFEATVSRLEKEGGIVDKFVHKDAGHILASSDYRHIVEGMAALRPQK